LNNQVDLLIEVITIKYIYVVMLIVLYVVSADLSQSHVIL